MGYSYMDSFKLRREYLEEYLDEIRSAVTGRCTPIKPLITDENGCFLLSGFKGEYEVDVDGKYYCVSNCGDNSEEIHITIG